MRPIGRISSFPTVYPHRQKGLVRAMLLAVAALLLGALVNAARLDAGLPALTPDHALTVTASDHALFMAETGIFDHWGRTYASPSDRTQAAGYDGTGVGETIAHSNHDNPSMVMTGFLESPPHRAILLDGDYTEMGVAVAMGRGRLYWVIDVGHD
jgi:uncharacterized protein YkwD